MRSTLCLAIWVPPGLSKKTSLLARDGNWFRRITGSKCIVRSPQNDLDAGCEGFMLRLCSMKKGGPMFGKILLAVDGSKNSLHAAKVAADLARAMNAKYLGIGIALDGLLAYQGDPILKIPTEARRTEPQT